MGAPKQKWSDKEEVALKAGVAKHGAGRWRTILEDPEFSSELYLRSNVDLKDKWRNMSAMINGLGSRATARQALKRVQQAPKMKHECRILLSDENIIPTMVCIEGMQKGSSSGPTVDKDEKTALSKSQHDLRSMTPAVVAAAVAQAVAEADTAIAAAEEALRVAEAAEANAEAIKAFADAAMMTLNGEPLEGW